MEERSDRDPIDSTYPRESQLPLHPAERDWRQYERVIVFGTVGAVTILTVSGFLRVDSVTSTLILLLVLSPFIGMISTPIMALRSDRPFSRKLLRAVLVLAFQLGVGFLALLLIFQGN